MNTVRMFVYGVVEFKKDNDKLVLMLRRELIDAGYSMILTSFFAAHRGAFKSKYVGSGRYTLYGPVESTAFGGAPLRKPLACNATLFEVCSAALRHYEPDNEHLFPTPVTSG